MSELVTDAEAAERLAYIKAHPEWASGLLDRLLATRTALIEALERADCFDIQQRPQGGFEVCGKCEREVLLARLHDEGATT